jgi:hypothetical protein
VKLRVPLAIVLAASLGLAACGGDSDEDNAERAIAEAIEQANEDVENAQDEADNANDDAANDDAANDEDAGTSDEDTDSSIPDMESLGDCMQISFAYAGLALASLGGSMGGEELSDADMAELRDSIDEIREGLPKDVQDDFEVVADAYNTLFDKGFMSEDAQDALESDEFTEASENVQAYIDDLCA